MKKDSLNLSVILASLLMAVGFCWIIFDYFQDMKVGRYEQETLDWVVESGVILAYCYLAYRFFQRQFIRTKQTSIQPLVNTRSKENRARPSGQSYSLVRQMTASTSVNSRGPEPADWLSTRSQRLR